MKKQNFILISILLILAVGVFALFDYSKNSDKEISKDKVDEYFFQKMFDKSVEKSGGAIPIEGFTPEMYIGLLENLQEEDFDNVRAINGVYEYESGEIHFRMKSEQLITSADGTVNIEGMGDLLDNLERRFGIVVNSEKDVDALIKLIE